MAVAPQFPRARRAVPLDQETRSIRAVLMASTGENPPECDRSLATLRIQEPRPEWAIRSKAIAARRALATDARSGAARASRQPRDGQHGPPLRSRRFCL